jgi:hypothetical protein
MTLTNSDRRSIWSDSASTRHPQKRTCLEGKTRRGKRARGDNAKRNPKTKTTRQLTPEGPAARGDKQRQRSGQVEGLNGSGIVKNLETVGIEKTRMA